MAEQYYMQNNAACGVDLEDTDLYDEVLDRDRTQYRELANSGPQCMMNNTEEHFGNLGKKNKWAKHLIFAIIFIVVLYLLYTFCLNNTNNNALNYDPNAMYGAYFVRN